jgi:Domain of unknown function (DUF5127)
MSLTANSSDGASHHVQVYSDVSGGTSDGSPKRVASPQLRCRMDLGGSNATDFRFPTISANAVIHNVGLQKQETFTETLDQAQWGTLYYAMKYDVS